LYSNHKYEEFLLLSKLLFAPNFRSKTSIERKQPEHSAESGGSANVQFACRSDRIPVVPFRDEAMRSGRVSAFARSAGAIEREEIQAATPFVFVVAV
jgi:hypothetical protein